MELSVYTIVVICLLITVIYKYLTRNYTYWKERGVIFESPLLFVGNILEFTIGKKHMGHIYEEIYQKYPNERFIGAFKLQKPDLIVCDLEDIKKVLISDFQYFVNRSDIFLKYDPLFHNLFNATSHKWKVMRQKLTPSFTSGKLRKMLPLMNEVGQEFSKYLQNLTEKEPETEFKEVMAKFTTDIIGSVAFGLKMNSMMDDDAPFRKMGRKMFKINTVELLKILLIHTSNGLFNLLRLQLQSKDIAIFFKNIVKETIKERIENGIKRNDFIDLMIELKNQDDNKKIDQNDNIIEVDDDFITAQAFLFFIAGFETSSTLMSFVLHKLALHPEIQEKVHKEIIAVLNKYNGEITYEAVFEMHYLDMVICETQRFYPALANIFRVCTIPYKFEGMTKPLDKNILVTIPVKAIHYDPKYYPDPDKFKPERFTQEERQKRHPMTFLPFGEGPRNCIGLRLGRLQSSIGLVILLKDYIVEPCSKTETKVVIDPIAFVTTSKNGIWLRIKKRN